MVSTGLSTFNIGLHEHLALMAIKFVRFEKKSNSPEISGQINKKHGWPEYSGQPC
jgi:hypothetical protein